MSTTGPLCLLRDILSQCDAVTWCDTVWHCLKRCGAATGCVIIQYSCSVHVCFQHSLFNFKTENVPEVPHTASSTATIKFIVKSSRAIVDLIACAYRIRLRFIHWSVVRPGLFEVDDNWRPLHCPSSLCVSIFFSSTQSFPVHCLMSSIHSLF